MTAQNKISLDDSDYGDDYDGFDVPVDPPVDPPAEPRRDRRSQQRPRRDRPRPAGAPEPQDYQPPAVQREAESEGADDNGEEFVTIDFAGPGGRVYTFTVPADPQDWPGSVLHALENRKALTAIEGLLGARAWMTIRDWKMRDINRLYERIAEEGGFAPQGVNAKGTAGGN